MLRSDAFHAAALLFLSTAAYSALMVGIVLASRTDERVVVAPGPRARTDACFWVNSRASAACGPENEPKDCTQIGQMCQFMYESSSDRAKCVRMTTTPFVGPVDGVIARSTTYSQLAARCCSSDSSASECTDELKVGATPLGAKPYCVFDPYENRAFPNPEPLCLPNELDSTTLQGDLPAQCAALDADACAASAECTMGFFDGVLSGGNARRPELYQCRIPFGFDNPPLGITEDCVATRNVTYPCSGHGGRLNPATLICSDIPKLEYNSFPYTQSYCENQLGGTAHPLQGDPTSFGCTWYECPRPNAMVSVNATSCVQTPRRLCEAIYYGMGSYDEQSRTCTVVGVDTICATTEFVA